MSNYKQVQFVPWEIHTGPIRDNYGKGQAYDYAGINFMGTNDRRLDVRSQCVDIEARIAFTKDAIEKACAVADTSDDVLKVFMAPEFLYRGSGGAYMHDLINGWTDKAPSEFALNKPFAEAWPGLFGGLRKIVSDDKYKNWIFIFGTASSAMFEGALSDDKYTIDINRPGAIFNSSLIQVGGSDNLASTYVVRKHFISGIDFLEYEIGANIHSNGTIVSPDNNSIIPNNVIGDLEGSCVFRFPNIKKVNGDYLFFGLEICLDHYGYKHIIDPIYGTIETSKHGRLRNTNSLVDIQLVASCGMRLQDDSISLLGDKLKSYAFNCDGLSCSKSTTKHVLGSHVEIWNQSEGNLITKSNKLMDIENDFITIPKDSIAINSSVELDLDVKVRVSDFNLWSTVSMEQISDLTAVKGSGYVTVSKVFDLN